MSHDKIKVIRVNGGPYERSFQHAQQLGEEALRGTLEFYRNFWKIKIAQMVPGMPSPVHSALRRLVENLIVKPGTRDWRLLARDRAILKGYSKGVKGMVSYEELKNAAAAPDTFNYWLGWLHNLMNVVLADPPLIPGDGIGCSTMVAWGSASTDGEMVFGRNLDFFTGDKWIDNAVLLVADTGYGEIPFVSVTSAGIPIEGITAMNADGMVISVHQNFTKAVNRKGRGIISISSEIISRASSIYEAIDIVTKTFPIAGWTIVVGSATEKQVVIIETNANTFDIIYPETDKPWTCYANCYLSPALQKDEFAPGYAWHTHNHSRLHRMRQMLEKNAGKINPEMMTLMLGDHFDPLAGKERPLGNTVTAVNNVTSAVMQPDRQHIWIATGPAPASNTAEYAGFDIAAIRRGEDGFLKSFPGTPFIKSDAYPALREYVMAYQEYDELNEEKVKMHLQNACRMDPEEPLYALMLGIILLKEGSINSALEKFREAENNPNNPYRIAQAYLWQGRCYDLLKMRSQARELYLRAHDSAPHDSTIKRFALKGLKNPFKYCAVKNVVTEFIMADLMEI